MKTKEMEELEEENKDLERALKNAEEKVRYHERFWERVTAGVLAFLVSTGLILIFLFMYIMFIFDVSDISLSNIQLIKTVIVAMMPSFLLGLACFKL